MVIGRCPGAAVSQPEVPGHWGFVMVLALTASLAARHHIDGDVAESACKTHAHLGLSFPAASQPFVMRVV